MPGGSSYSPPDPTKRLHSGALANGSVLGGLGPLMYKAPLLAPVHLRWAAGKGDVRRCHKCGLTLADPTGNQLSSVATRHAEQAALRALRDVHREEEARQKKMAEKKQRQRREYDIGWNPARVPRNMVAVSKLGLELSTPEGLCCLAFDEAARKVRVMAGTEPASCVNLEYLSLALQVRMQAGREPQFSLDPLDKKKDRDSSMQAKCFQPEWLMGTSLGEVMFQADYHLKELAMGEYEQPVVGMKSAFDFTEVEGVEELWHARAWFVVKDAEVFVTDGDVLIPRIKMGVEAREQKVGEHGTTDLPVTRPDHPLVKYADLFAQNFDLIAERKSVVRHLVEAAKAAVLAKFLVESRTELDEQWFNLVDWAEVKEAVAGCCLEIPQLWKDRTHSEVRLRNGAVVVPSKGLDASTTSLYGGVDYGMGAFGVPPGRKAPPHMLAAGAGLMARTLAPPRRPLAAAGLAARPGLRMSLAPMAPRLVPQGVDLNLDNFDLSAPTRLAEDETCHQAVSAETFWELIDGHDAKLDSCEADEDVALLRAVFNPQMSDRRSEGECFVCPDLSPAHIKELRRLVEKELEVQEQRKEHFLSQDFVAENVGPLFPSSWAFSAAVPHAADHRKRVPSSERVEVKELKRAAVVFDRTSEDGTHFRAYKLGSLEVRSTQERRGEEVIGAVFALGSCGHVCRAEEKTLKVTVASVEPASAIEKNSKEPAGGRKTAPADDRKQRLAKLIYSGGDLRADREVVLAAVERDGLALERAAEKLRGDREVVETAVKDQGGALRYASEELRRDRDLVLAALEDDGCALEHASEELRGDRGVAAAALHSNSFAMKALAPGLRSDRELILSAVQRNAFALEHASEELLADPSFLLAAVRRNALVLEELPRELRADRDFMLRVVRENGFALKYASEELRADGELISAAVQQDRRAGEYADKAAWERYREQEHESGEGCQADGANAVSVQ